MAVLISAHNLAKSFGSKRLFSGLTFSIEDSQKIGLIGPNGAGKSTLIKILTGDQSADAGTIGKNKELKIGYLEQDPKFDPQNTIIESILDESEFTADSRKLQKAYELISKLDLDSNKIPFDSKISELSEGWKKRVALARELIKEPNLLILDEPTNHLDVQSILWLENFLSSQNRIACLIVTHDRLFLQNTCNVIFDLDPRLPDNLLKTYSSYDQHLESKEMLLASMQRLEDVKKNTLRREVEWLRRGAKARQTKQKARIERAHQLGDEVSQITEKNRQQKVDIDFGSPDRTPKKLIEAKDISLQFVSPEGSAKNIFKNFSYIIGAKTRLGLLGTNGSGKSSLIKVLLKELEPSNGKVLHHDEIKIAFFEQKKQSMDTELSVLKFICPDGDYVHFQGQPIFARSYLSRFNFNSQQMDLKIRHLSGGEKSRLFIAQLMLTSASILVLDEPTNDLDLETLDVLADCLRSYTGAVILVSHNRHFMDSVVNEIHAFTEQDGELIKFADYFQWEDWFLNSKKKGIKQSESDAAIISESKAPTKKGKLSYKEQIEFDKMEETIAEEEKLLAELQATISSVENQSNYAKISELGVAAQSKEAEIAKLYDRWQVLTNKLNGES